jgi:transcriptional regulator with XRE-family HTH domain
MAKRTPFGKLIAEARKAQDLEQSELADNIRVNTGEKMSQGTLAHIERGKIKPNHYTALKLIDALTADNAELKAEMLDALEHLEKNFKEKTKYPTFQAALSSIMDRLELQYAPLMRGMFDQSMAQHLKEGIRLPSPEKLKELLSRLKKNKATPEELLDLERAYIYDSIVEHSRFTNYSLATRREMARAASDVFAK